MRHHPPSPSLLYGKLILIYYVVDSRENGGVKEAAYYDYAGVGPCDFNNATSNYEELDAVSYIECYYQLAILPEISLSFHTYTWGSRGILLLLKMT